MEAQEILQDIVFVILYGVVMGLSIAAALYLLLRRSNAIAPGVTPPLRLRIWAAAIMLENVFSHVLWLWYFCHPSALVYIIICALDFLLLIPISYLLHAKKTKKPKILKMKTAWPHFSSRAAVFLFLP